jgi:hypothetical protein
MVAWRAASCSLSPSGALVASKSRQSRIPSSGTFAISLKTSTAFFALLTRPSEALSGPIAANISIF